MSDIDLAKAVGWEDSDIPVAWTKRDLLLYALGIGAKHDDYALVNELHESWTPFPTYPVVLTLKGAEPDVNDFKARVSSRGGKGGPPGLPKFDPNRVVHGAQSVQVIKPLPAVSGEGWKLKRRVVGVSENKSGIIVDAENLLVDPKGEVYSKLYTSSFHLGAKAYGKAFSKRIAGPPQPSITTPSPQDRKPDWVITDETSANQAVLYRLSGDYNQLHIDPKIGQAAGFGGVILHGLSTFGFGARAIVNAVAPHGDPSALQFYSVRFTSPVRPGDRLETAVWEVGPVKGEEGLTEVVFVMKNLTSGKVCLGGGVAWVKKTEKSKL